LITVRLSTTGQLKLKSNATLPFAIIETEHSFTLGKFLVNVKLPLDVCIPEPQLNYFYLKV